MTTKYHWLWNCLARYTPLYKHVLVASVVINLLSLSMPLFIMNVYDRIVPNNAFESLWVLAIGMTIAVSLDVFLRTVRIRFVDIAGRNADVKLQSLFFKHLMDVRLDALYTHPETKSIGAIITRVRELEYVRDFIGSSTLLALMDLPFMLLFIALTFYIGGAIAVIPLFTVPLLVIFALLVQSSFARTSREQMHANALKQSFLNEVVSSLETTRATRMERVLLKHWEAYTGKAADANIRTRAHLSMHANGMTYFTTILTVLLVIVGVYRIADGLMTTGGLIACVILFGRCAGPINALVNILAHFQKTLLAVKQLHTFLDLPRENPEVAIEDSITENTLPQKMLAVPFVFEKVSFSYPSAQQQNLAVKDIQLQVSAGAKIAFVGPSGSGKSTLARLFAGIYSPTEGRVLLGDMDMRHVPMRPFRNTLGFLPQEIRIFRGTLRHNIALAWPYEGPCQEEALVKAATLAGVMDFASQHPLGLDMPLGEQGTGLSGGQAQCVALARALLGDPHTLILDEPAAQLDTASEQRLVQRLIPYLKDKTVLLFTHKAHMLNLVDRVVAIEKGRTVWTGSRQEAVEQKKI